MNTKYKTADAYDSSITQKCEIALVALLRAFGTFKSNIRLIGGLAPRYITPERPPEVPPHSGTTDVDIVLNVAVLDQEGSYAKLKAQLKDNGFERLITTEGKASSWQWRYTGVDIPIVIEFLQGTDIADENGKLGSVDGEDVSAIKFMHANLAHKWYGSTNISIELPNGEGVATETINFSDAITFIILKTFAFDHRRERKDSADLLHVMRYSGDISTMAKLYAERMQDVMHEPVLNEVLAKLEMHFCDTGESEGWRKEGPTKYAIFQGLNVGTDESEMQRRDVSGMVEHFVRSVRSECKALEITGAAVA